MSKPKPMPVNFRSIVNPTRLEASISDPDTHVVGDTFEKFDINKPPYSNVFFFPTYYYDFRNYALCKHKHETIEEAKECVAHLNIKPKDLEIVEIREKWVSMTVYSTVHTNKFPHSYGRSNPFYHEEHMHYQDGFSLTPEQIREKADAKKAENRIKYGKKSKETEKA